MPDYSARNIHGQPALVPGDRVAFDETYPEDVQGPPWVFGSVTGYSDDPGYAPKTMVNVQWDDDEWTQERADQVGNGAFHAFDSAAYWHKH